MADTATPREVDNSAMAGESGATGADPAPDGGPAGGGSGSDSGSGAADPAATSRELAGRELGRALKGTMAAVRRLRGRDTHRAGEIAHAQYALLFELADRGELSAGDLAAAAELAPATVTGMLDHLEEAGLVVRARAEHDRRIVVSRLTAAGRERVAARRARVTPLWDAALAEFDASELRVATAVLDGVREFFETLDVSQTPCDEAPEPPA